MQKSAAGYYRHGLRTDAAQCHLALALHLDNRSRLNKHAQRIVRELFRWRTRKKFSFQCLSRITKLQALESSATSHSLRPEIAQCISPPEATSNLFKPLPIRHNQKLVVWRPWHREFPTSSLANLLLSVYNPIPRRETTATSTARPPTHEQLCKAISSQSQHDLRTRVDIEVRCKMLATTIRKYPAANPSHDSARLCVLDATDQGISCHPSDLITISDTSTQRNYLSLNPSSTRSADCFRSQIRSNASISPRQTTLSPAFDQRILIAPTPIRYGLYEA